MTVLKIQERLTTLELEKDDLEQYGCWVSMRINNVPVESEETSDSIYEKDGKFSREACLNVPVPCIDKSHHTVSECMSY